MSVPCERLFLGGGEIATDRQSRLGANKFEYLQVLKHAWHSGISDRATTNSSTIESIDIDEVHLEQFKELLVYDGEMEHELKVSSLQTSYCISIHRSDWKTGRNRFSVSLFMC